MPHGSRLKNGGNLTDVFALSSAGGKISLGTKLVSLKQKTGSTFNGNFATKDLIAELDSDQLGSAIDDLIANYAVTEAETTDDEPYEDNVTASASSLDINKLVGCLHYGAKSNDQRRVLIHIAKVSSASETWAAGATVKKPLTFTAVENDVPIEVLATQFDSSYVTGALTTIPAKAMGKVAYLTA